MLDSAAASSRFCSGIGAMSHTEPGGWGVRPSPLLHGRSSPAHAEAPSRWSPGLDVRGDAELVHYLMMRAVQEQKDGRGLTSLGADLGGSYEFFRKSELGRMLPGRNEEANGYLSLVQRAVSGDSHEHPKIAITAERAFRAWRKGDKTLVFCFNIATVKAVQTAVNSRIDAYTNGVLTVAFKCAEGEAKTRIENFQKRLYNYRQSVFLLFQDHPFAGAERTPPPQARPPQARCRGSRGTTRTRRSAPATAVAASTVAVFSPPPSRCWWPGGRNPPRGGNGSKGCSSHCALRRRFQSRPISSWPRIGLPVVVRSSKGFFAKRRSRRFPTMKTSTLPDITDDPKMSPHGRTCSKVGRVKRRSPPTCRPRHRGAEPAHALALGGAGASARKAPRAGRAHAPSRDPLPRLPRPVHSGRPGHEAGHRRRRSRRRLDVPHPPALPDTARGGRIRPRAVRRLPGNTPEGCRPRGADRRL